MSTPQPGSPGGTAETAAAPGPADQRAKQSKKTWLAGAALLGVGLAAGSGITAAVMVDGSAGGSSGFSSGQRGPGGGGGPGGQAPGGGSGQGGPGQQGQAQQGQQGQGQQTQGQPG